MEGIGRGITLLQSHLRQVPRQYLFINYHEHHRSNPLVKQRVENTASMLPPTMFWWSQPIFADVK
jgi:hypothetical protein